MLNEKKSIIVKTISTLAKIPMIVVLAMFIAGTANAQTEQSIVGLWLFSEFHTILEITEDRVTRYGSDNFYVYKILDDNKMWQRHGDKEQILKYQLSNDGYNLLMVDVDGTEYFGEKIKTYFQNTDFVGKYVPDIKKTNIASLEIIDDRNALFDNDLKDEITSMKYVLTEGKFFLIGCCKYWIFEIQPDGLCLKGHDGEDWGIFSRIEEIEPVQESTIMDSMQATITDTIQSPLPSLSNIKIYPNPTPDKFIVDYDNFSQVKICDMNGRELLTQTGNGKMEIEISHLPKGIYIVSVVSDGKIVGTSKIVKQ